jgi:[acyl-carrier-protein] S-malonyltransferase
MGKDLFERSTRGRELFQLADDVLGVSLTKICFDGPDDALRQTVNTQPAIFLHSIVLAKLVDASDVSMVAGHSLGEYSALVVAGTLSFEDGLKLVRLRGELMQRAGERQPGTMAAVVGMEPEALEFVCTEASSDGIVQCANFNSPGQIVISGSVDSVRRAMMLARARGAKLVKELPVSGAFHSPLMQYAQDGLREALTDVRLNDARIPVYANVTAQPVQNAGEIRTLLAQQLTHAVRWEESVRRMTADGARSFVEIGPGKVLQGLVKRIDATVEVRGIDTFEDVERFTLTSA